MAETKNPNLLLAEEIVLALKAKNLILDKNVKDLTDYFADGKMKDTAWKKAFENKINSLSKANET
jgi:hypothetical protein